MSDGATKATPRLLIGYTLFLHVCNLFRCDLPFIVASAHADIKAQNRPRNAMFSNSPIVDQIVLGPLSGNNKSDSASSFVYLSIISKDDL